MVITGVADRVPEKFASLVYLEPDELALAYTTTIHST